MVCEGRRQEEARGHHWVTGSLASCPSPWRTREHPTGQELRWQGLPQPGPSPCTGEALEQAHTSCPRPLCPNRLKDLCLGGPAPRWEQRIL